jgi:predicted lipoprotein with Yx(FWY)xxD motif
VSPVSGGAETVLSSNVLDRGEQLVVEMNGQKLSLYTLIGPLIGQGQRTCYGRCATMFLPLTDRGRIVVANRSCHQPASTAHNSLFSRSGSTCHIDQGQLGTIKRKDGSLQVTYHRLPLYRYRNDKKTGQLQGQGKDHQWTAVLPNGGWYCGGLPAC